MYHGKNPYLDSVSLILCSLEADSQIRIGYKLLNCRTIPETLVREQGIEGREVTNEG